MRFMLLMIPKGYEIAPAGTLPTSERVEQMMRYSQALKRAGVLIALEGLHPPSMGVRVTFEAGAKVIDGPFAGVKETLGGYWMIQVRSREEAIEWAKRCPAAENESIEVRQVQELADFQATLSPARD
jgi:hypothetical protein